MGSLSKFIVIRVLLFFPLFFFLLSIVFFLLRVLPGSNPIRALYPQMPEDQIQLLYEQYGLDDPIHVQYFNYLVDAIQFDFGNSIKTKRPIIDEIIQPFAHTVTLAVFACLIGIPLGIYLGGIAGKNRERMLDQSIRVYTIAFYATPVFLVGIMLQILFAYNLRILPANNIITAGNTAHFDDTLTHFWIIDTLMAGRPDITWDYIKHLILPSLTLGMLIATSIARQVRTHMINQLQQDYIAYAKSRGISDKKVTYSYALKNAVLPVINLMGLQFALLLSGAILTETVFNIPGLGRYIFQAINLRDFPRIQAAIILFTLIVSLISLLSDIIYGLLDPRISY